MKMTQQILEELIEILEEQFKNKLPTSYISEFELGRLIGRQDVVRHLYALLEREQNVSKSSNKR